MAGPVKTLVVVFVLALSTSAHADHGVRNGVESLSPELRSLLSKEMVSIQDGMMSVISAYASGNSEEIVSIAEKIKNSYILRQSMTRQQRHELHEKLPASFVELDRQFHNYAGSLEEAARNSNNELIGFYFSKLTESCAGCHSRHAKHKFPAFEEQKEGNGKSQ